jgi:hypothetical protein
MHVFVTAPCLDCDRYCVHCCWNTVRNIWPAVDRNVTVPTVSILTDPRRWPQSTHALFQLQTVITLTQVSTLHFLVCNLKTMDVRILFATRTRWRSSLRHCCTSRKVAGSISDSVITIFHWHNPFGRTMALGSTQPLTEMSTGNISWGVKAAGAYGWQPYHLHVPIDYKSVSLNLLEP